MHPAAQRFIEVLSEDVAAWENAATSCEYVVQYLSDPKARKEWEGMAKEYRARAESYKSMIEHTKKDHGA
jgi:hypothetical protein